MTREYTELASSTSIGRKVVRFAPTPMMIKPLIAYSMSQ